MEPKNTKIRPIVGKQADQLREYTDVLCGAFYQGASDKRAEAWLIIHDYIIAAYYDGMDAAESVESSALKTQVEQALLSANINRGMYETAFRGRQELIAENLLLLEFIEEVSLPPYRDSDPASILRTLQTRAKHLLARHASASPNPSQTAPKEGE